MTTPLDITVIILTRNESIHIARALDNISNVARIIVVDSFSTDRTVEIARSKGALVLQNQFINYAKQFQWALDNCSIETAWVMRLDADEVLGNELLVELQRTIPKLPPDVVGINLKRKHIFLGRWVRFGGRYPLSLLRIWRNGHAKIEDRWMDEHMVVWGGTTITLRGNFSDWNLNDLTFFTAKHNGYATREAIDVLGQRYGLFNGEQLLSVNGTGFQASAKRFLKLRVYNRLPFWVSPALYFLWRYLFQLGMLDGRTGLIYHVLQGFWYRFLVGAKVLELDRQLQPLADKDSRLARLEYLTGHALTERHAKGGRHGN